jgi:phosphonopyruvate decarboxylase
MIKAGSFVKEMQRLGYDHWSGVPCSFFKPFINYVIDDQHLEYIGATNEGEAVAISLGAHLAGRRTVTMCQNSGLGNMINPLTSLNHPFRVPTLLITTWRGEPGVKDEPQHEQMGQILHRLIDTLEIPWRPFPQKEAGLREVVEEAHATMAETRRPFALIMSKGTVEPYSLSSTSNLKPIEGHEQTRSTKPLQDRMIRTEALEAILEGLRGDEVIIATTGKTGRELYEIKDRANQLYVVGGMGTASAIGLGIAHARPRQRVVILDGDGAALMHLGNLATIGAHAPENLLHVVLDNEAHDSTGGQATVSPIVRMTQIALGLNYRHAVRADAPEDVTEVTRELMETGGPSMLHVKIRPGSPEGLGRPKVRPFEVADRLKAFINENASRSAQEAR